MTFEDLKKLYLKKKAVVGEEAYKYVSQILKEAKVLHKRDWKKNPTAGGDHEQSWRAFKGKNMEKLILFIIRDAVEAIGLKIISGNKLERAKRSVMNFRKSNENYASTTMNTACTCPM